MQIITTNHGPLITHSDYFGSDYETAGKFTLSTNAGVVRVLWPRYRRREIDEMRACEYVILTRGLFDGQEGLELLFEDHTNSPYCLHCETSSVLDMLPGDPGDSAWIVTIWMLRDGKPNKILERPAHWRRAATLPYLKPLRNQIKPTYADAE